jgi:hypothetical protein
MCVLAEYFVAGAALDPAPDAAVAGTNLEAAGAAEAAEAPAPVSSSAAAGMGPVSAQTGKSVVMTVHGVHQSKSAVIGPWNKVEVIVLVT